MSFQFGDSGLGYTPTDLMSEGHPFRQIGLGFVERRRKDAAHRQNAERAPMAPVGGTQKLEPVRIPQAGPIPTPDFPSAQQLRGMQDAANEAYKGWFTGNGPSLLERMQGWGPDLGSRIGEAGGGVNTYSLAGMMQNGRIIGGAY